MESLVPPYCPQEFGKDHAEAARRWLMATYVKRRGDRADSCRIVACATSKRARADRGGIADRCASASYGRHFGGDGTKFIAS